MIWENIQLSFSSLKANKMRSLLTMLGIIIGIMSIITIVIIGDALTESVSGELAGLGGNNIMLSVQERTPEGEAEDDGFGPGNGGGNPFGNTSLTGRTPLSNDLISDQMIADMRTHFQDEIAGVSLSHSLGSGEARDLELYANVSITGVNSDFFLANDIELLEGRLISDSDQNSMVAVVSDRLVERMFPPGTDPIGQQIRLFMPTAIEVYTIIGVYRHEQSGFSPMGGGGSDTRTDFYIPLATARHGILERNHTTITVLAGAGQDINAVTASLQTYFDDMYANNEFWRVDVLSMASVLDMVSTMLGTISLAIALIAGISLLVGGIGVMNIMLVSVTERTREIGTRKALGAKNFHIRFQFVVEALIVSLIGGVIGLLMGIVLGGLVSGIFGASLVLNPVIIIACVLFSMAIGVFFGLYPANKAAKLDPIEALRYE